MAEPPWVVPHPAMPRPHPHGLNGRSGPQVAVGYLRRSTDRQEQSIPDQRKAIERYAAEHDLELARFFVDDAISGTSAVRRPAFQEMVGLAQQDRRPFSYVIVYDVKRFGRLDNDEAGYYRHILRTHGVEVLYVGENFSGDATDDLLRPVKQWQAREESKDLAKVTIRGMLSRVESGYWNGGSPPFGYDLRYESPREDGGAFLLVLRFQPDGSKLVLDESGKVVRTLARGERLQVSKRDRSRLVLSSPERVELVRRIFTMSAIDRMGYRAISNVLNEEGVPSPRNAEWSHIYSGAWTASTIRSILTNPMYVGDLVWNRRTDARFFKVSNGNPRLHGVPIRPVLSTCSPRGPLHTGDPTRAPGPTKRGPSREGPGPLLEVVAGVGFEMLQPRQRMGQRDDRFESCLRGNETSRLAQRACRLVEW